MLDKLVGAPVKADGTLTCEVKQTGFCSPLKTQQCIAAVIENLWRQALVKLVKHGLNHDAKVLVDTPALADVIDW